MLKVGLNLLFLGDRAGGVGRYATELVAALAQRDEIELELFTADGEPAELRRQPWAGRVRFTQLPVRRQQRASYIAATFAAMPAIAAAHRLDILHSPANVGPVVVPGVKSVITVHDLIWMRAGDQWDTPAAVKAMRRSSTITVPRASRIITVSQASAQDLIELLGVDQRRLDVIASGVKVDANAAVTSEPELRSRLGLSESRVILCVAQKRPYKRQDLLIRALPDLPDDVMLVLPGAATAYESQLRALAGDLGVGGRVIFPAWIDDADLEGLYRLADCFALPSELEGFGLPVLEAMARGLPVACSNRTSLPEVAADAALLFDPGDQAAVTRALAKILGDRQLTTELIGAGYKRAGQFSWQQTADKTVASYERALADPS